ncbi:MAG: low temperature requirement protein A, partial [Actinomycetes bacterium]
MRADQADGADHRAGAAGAWYRPMVARPTDEEHRSATVLELFFDLCFVVAVAQAAAALHHEVADGHVGDGVVGYATVFFAIWWAWMNFTWFASAYDNDDAVYRLVTLVQIAGVLVLAAGVSQAFEHGNYLVVWLGYLIMRVAMATHWLRAAASTTGAERRVAQRYAGGVLACQIGWLALLFTPTAAQGWVFLAMAILEMCVPVYAERDRQT